MCCTSEARAAPAGSLEAASKEKSEKEVDVVGSGFLCVVLDAMKHIGSKKSWKLVHTTGFWALNEFFWKTYSKLAPSSLMQGIDHPRACFQ